MRSESDVREVFRLAALGLSQAEVARRTAIPRSTVRGWLGLGEPGTLSCPFRAGSHAAHDRSECARIADIEPTAYAYLLGQYLGDGSIAVMRNGVQRLRITTCDQYPDIRAECERAVAAVMPHNKVGLTHNIGCTDVWSYSNHWICLFPQHGPGLKHGRRIELEPWQETIAFDLHPRLFVRGLLHSDGWRGMNRVKGANGQRYAYSRYMFSNRSDDIRALFVAACDRLDIETRRMNFCTIAVSKRASVALLDRFVGPKS